MRDYPFSFDQLNQFSMDMPYHSKMNDQEKLLLKSLSEQKHKLNFPSIREDIGQFVNFIFQWVKPKYIFEFGSGYGHSCFWYLLNNPFIQKIILTEKRSDLVAVYNTLPWPKSWRSKIDYYQADAFDVFSTQTEVDYFDFILIDGVKSDYLSFLKKCEDKISPNGMILIDNSYWRGSFLDEKMVETKKTAQKIKELHQYLNESPLWSAVFIPYEDGVTLVKKL